MADRRPPATVLRPSRAFALLGLALVVLLTAPRESAADLDEEALREAVSRVLNHAEESHYSNIQVDDRISQATLDNYLAALDPQRLFFTAEEEVRFREQYGDRLDDAMRQGQIEPVFEIHRLYLHRHAEFRDLAQNYLKTLPNLNTSREWLLDRSAAPRPANQAEMEELWRDWVRHKWINLMLEGRSYQTAGAWLRHNYRFGDPIRVDADGFSFSLGQSPGENQSDSDPLDSRSAFALFLNSFARSLDPNSGYSSPESMWELAERFGNFGRIPLFLALEGEYLVVRERQGEVIAAIEGGPQEGDRIIGVDPFGDGEVIDVVGWQPFEVHKLMLGPKGTTVALRVSPAGGQTGAVEQKMERIEIVTKEMKRALRWTPKWLMKRSMNKMLQSQRNARTTVLEVQQNGQTLHVGVIRIPAIYAKCTRDVKRLVGELKAERVDALVVDLRDNIFSEGDEVVSLTGLFVGKGPISQERDPDGKVRVLRNRRQDAIWDGPLAVLVNQISSSASEVLAAAIQDYGRGVVVGESTLGRGTRQVEHEIKASTRDKSEDAILGITNRKVYRVTGSSVDQTGIRPDVQLPTADEYSWLAQYWAPGFVRSRGEQASSDPLPPDEVPAADFRSHEKARLPLESLAVRHQQRESQDPHWRLITSKLELSRKRTRHQTEPIHLDQRRKNQDTQWAEELALARAWLDAKDSEEVLEPALARFLLQRKDRYLRDSSASAEEEPALVKALMLARGHVVVPDETGFRQEAYDLPLQQTALIVIDLAELRKSAATALTASARNRAAGIP